MACGSRCLRRRACWLVITSQMPSHASMTNSSPSRSWHDLTCGSPMRFQSQIAQPAPRAMAAARAEQLSGVPHPARVRGRTRLWHSCDSLVGRRKPRRELEFVVPWARDLEMSSRRRSHSRCGRKASGGRQAGAWPLCTPIARLSAREPFTRPSTTNDPARTILDFSVGSVGLWSCGPRACISLK